MPFQQYKIVILGLKLTKQFRFSINTELIEVQFNMADRRSVPGTDREETG